MNRYEKLVDDVVNLRMTVELASVPYNEMNEVPNEIFHILDSIVSINGTKLEMCNKIRLLIDKAYINGYIAGQEASEDDIDDDDYIEDDPLGVLNKD